MTEAVEEYCQGGTASGGAGERFADATVAAPVGEKARREAVHRAGIDAHTENGASAELREPPAERGRPRT